jgi:hypothetical protein
MSKIRNISGATLSLWTPSGEHRVEPTTKDAPTTSPGSAPAAGAAPGGPGEPSLEDLGPEQRAQVEEMARQMEEARVRMLRMPAGAVLGQQALQFYELAAIYLSEQPARLADARMAIDALAAVVERLGNRLGEAEQPLRQALNQLQMAFVEATNATNAGPAGAETSGTDAGPGPTGDAG